MRVIFSLNIRVQTMDFGRKRGFPLDGEDPPEKVGYVERRVIFWISCMVMLMYVIIIIIIIIIIIAKCIE